MTPKQTLDWLAQQHFDQCCEERPIQDWIRKMKSQLPEQPEQEPVAWRNAALRVGEDLCSVGPFGYYDMTAAQWLDWALNVVTVHAPPPQRTWVGLTDEKKYELADDVARRGIPVFEAICEAEAKLKAKNERKEKNT